MITKSTNPCQLFQLISSYVWRKVISHHSTGIEVSEIGITKEIVSIIRAQFNLSSLLGVWANQGFDEAENGSDLDVFIEVSPSRYAWYAIQAKALQSNLRYTGINKMSGDNMDFQWQKLESLENRSGCLGFYLLYNGISGVRLPLGGIDFCGKGYPPDQLGCSLIEYDVISSFYKPALGLKNFINPDYYDLHPPAQPWRILTCCNKFTGTRLYSLKQIKDRVRLYKDLNGFAFNDADEDYSDFTGGGNQQFEDIKAITKASKESDWNPGYTLLLGRNF